MLSTGIDLVEIPRLERIINRYGDRFLARIYTPLEIAICRGRSSELAVRFAAKEAVSKALGVGIFNAEGIAWRDVEILPNRLGKPLVYLYGKAMARAQGLGLTEFALSLTHDGGLAVAFVVAQGAGGGEDLNPTVWRETLEKWVAENVKAPA